MAVHTRETVVGLFVMLGLLIGIGAVVWLGASNVLEGGPSYVAYFDESVGAIGSGSPVKYLGLEVGSVTDISVSPDPMLMAVVMTIRRPGLVTDHTVAEIEIVGFTGVGFVELSQKTEKVAVRQLSFQPPLPVIASQRSGGFGSLVADARHIAERVEALDLQGVVDELRATARSTRNLVTGPDIHRTVDNLARASDALNDITTRVDRMVASDSFERMPEEAERALSDAQAAITVARKQIEALRLAQTSREVKEAVGAVSDRSQVITVQVEELLQDLLQASQSLNRLLERLDRDPSALIFGKPIPRRHER
jgi:phospholipid/cholesterol/gamma-HCH transport system substrate-binding protein